MNKVKRFLSTWGLPLLWMAAIFGMSSLGTNEPPEPHLATIVLKKIGHVTEYALLAVLFVRALTASRPPARWTAWAALTLTVLYAVTDEIHQTYVPGRHGQALDVLIDFGGALLGLYLWRRWREGHIGPPRFWSRRALALKRGPQRAG